MLAAYAQTVVNVGFHVETEQAEISLKVRGSNVREHDKTFVHIAHRYKNAHN